MNSEKALMSAVFGAGLSIHGVVVSHVAALWGSLSLLSISHSDASVVVIDIGGGGCSAALVHFFGGVSMASGSHFVADN